MLDCARACSPKVPLSQSSSQPLLLFTLQSPPQPRYIGLCAGMNAADMSNLELASDSIVDRVYEQLKAMAVSYEFKPGERLNEGELAKRLGVSRTPLREALNRLNTEGFLRFTPGKGFFCRELDAHEIFDLYELRKSIEVASVRLAVKRAKDEDIDALLKFLEATGPDPGERSSVELVELDETFH